MRVSSTTPALSAAIAAGVWAVSVVVALVVVVVTRRSNSDDSNSDPDPLEEHFLSATAPASTVAIASVMYNPVDLSAWMAHHRALGVRRFYVRLEDSPGHVEYMRSSKDVLLELGTRDRENGNYFSIMDRQKRFVDLAIEHSIASGDVDFVFNIDADELLIGDLKTLDRLPEKVKCVHLKNAEAVYDGTEEGCFDTKRFRMCSIDSRCRSYINGKGGGRAVAGVAQSGPHYFSFEGATRGPHQRTLRFSDLGVLHFDSCSFASWSQKFINMAKDNVVGGGKGGGGGNTIPFRFYNDSIQAAAGAYEVYKKYVMIEDGGEAPLADVVEIEHFDESNEHHARRRLLLRKEDHEEEEEEEGVEKVSPSSSSSSSSSRLLSDWISGSQAVGINLDRNRSRWAELKRQYGESDLAKDRRVPLWRFQAVVGATLEIDRGLLTDAALKDLLAMERRGFRRRHHDLTRGAVGCFLSHWMIFEELVKDVDCDSYVVFEDDATIRPTLAADAGALLVPDDWDVVLLGTHRVNAESVGNDLLRVHGFWGLFGYVINKTGARKCVDMFSSQPIDAQIDSRMSWMTRLGDADPMRLNIYCPKKTLVSVNPMFDRDTDIQWPIKESADAYHYLGVQLL